MLIKSNLLTPLLATFHLPTPKIIITIFGNTKISNVRITFDSEAKVSCITLETAIRLGLLITKSQSITLKIITKIKSCFIGYANNIAVTVGDLVICIWFYIIDILGIKIILSFLFFRKVRLSF